MRVFELSILSKSLNEFFVCLCLCLGLVAVLQFQLDYFDLIPGDLGDARLNTYFLENTYQFVRGNSDSLWHLNFYFPFPYIVGFSDNLYGSAPIYGIFRFLGADTQSSFQLWFLFGYILNFYSAYYALRKLSGTYMASAIGALIYAFALPTVVHAGHAQLHYRPGIPISFLFTIKFLENPIPRYLLLALAFLVWQFYIGIYMGFFSSIMIAALVFSNFLIQKILYKRNLKRKIEKLIQIWKKTQKIKSWSYSLLLILLLLLIIVLFFPYLKVSQLYSAKRSWSEIAIGLPRLGSYLLTDLPILSELTKSILPAHPLRYEHKMFFGIIPITLAIFSLAQRKSTKEKFYLLVSTGTLLTIFVTTVYIDGYSIWYLFHKIPLFSAVRVMTRIDQALLFPLCIIAMISVKNLQKKLSTAKQIIILSCIPLLLYETSLVQMYTSKKSEHKARIAKVLELLPENLPSEAILFFAQRSSFSIAEELDSMLITQQLGLKTVNGYSGNIPPGVDLNFSKNCDELENRLRAFLKLTEKKAVVNDMDVLKARVIRVGFQHCE